MRELRPAEWIKYGGLVTWVLAVIPLFLIPVLREEPTPVRDMIGWWSAAILFLLAFWHPEVRLQQKGPLWRRAGVLAFMTLAAFAVSYFSRSGLGLILAIIVAGVLPWLLPRSLSLAWVVGTAVISGVLVALLPGAGWVFGLVQVIVTLALMMFVYLASLLALNQVHARDELRRLNSELRATQALLAENTRIAERVRIARELHDLIGHHLTALSLNLEVASHLTGGKAREHTDQAASIARLLLSDVREVVSDMRRDDRVDLGQSIRELAAGVPQPAIHLDMPEELSLTDPMRAQILLRCAQEIITNAARHARAENLWIRLRATDGGVALDARDDGLGAEKVTPGHGLTGMMERLKALGGRLEISTRPGAGFRLEAWMPIEAGT